MSDSEKLHNWQIYLTAKALKQKRKLPDTVVEKLARLIADMEQDGPIQKEWVNFSALKKGKDVPDNAYHCHIKKGRPTYVVCWQVKDKKIQIIEIYYVGTHENAPY
jgi:hypothetical protein